MPGIRIEFVPVKKFYLGWFGLDHLQLVYDPSPTPGAVAQDDWFVIEGIRDDTGPRLTLGVEGWDGVTTLSAANSDATGQALVDLIGTPQMRGGRVVPGGLDAWQTLASYAENIAAMELPYVATGLPWGPTATINSTSVIASLLHYIDVDISQVWPLGIRLSPGYATLIGTSDGDDMSIGGSFTNLVGGEGDDTMHGSSRAFSIEKFYGGIGNDRFMWSPGYDIVHGGQAALDYGQDGTDTLDLTGVGAVTIIGNRYAVDQKTPDYWAMTANGLASLYSIERIEWDRTSDVIRLRNGADVIEDGSLFDFGSQSNSDHGDSFDLSEEGEAVRLAVFDDDEIVVTRAEDGEDDAGLWLRSLEWFVATGFDDEIYTGGGLRGAEGGSGNDIIDARLVTPFTGSSPQGYDIELLAGDGNDTLVSGAGRTYAEGGDGADTFVLSSISSGAGTVEFVIADASSDDRLLVPYDYFNGSGGDYDGSELMPILGAIGSFSDLQRYGWPIEFTFQTESQQWYGTDYSQGVITFIGRISFDLDGTDLLIHVQTGGTRTQTVVIDDAGHTATFTYMFARASTETIVRVVDFDEGDLGIHFHDPGTATDVTLDGGLGGAIHYSNWDDATHVITSDGNFVAPLDPRPTAPTTRPEDRPQRGNEHGTPNGDLIAATGPSFVDSGDGNDTVIGSAGDDVIDGGSGDDVMQGGGGDDVYVVDSAGDVVIEGIGGGTDMVVSSIDYALSANIENVTLGGTAVSALGNTLANRLIGNDAANLLDGGDGGDTLVGNIGDDTLAGGSGADFYIYAAGDGDDEILDTGAVQDFDELQLVGIDPALVSFYRLAASPADLVLAFAEGGSILVRNQATAAGGIDAVLFDDLSEWSRADLDARFAAAEVLDALPPQAIDDPYVNVATIDTLIPAGLLLANDRDPGGTGLAIVALTNISAGSASINGDGDIVLALPTGFTGEFGFDYTITDGFDGTSTAHADLYCHGNGAPTLMATIPDAAVAAGTAFTVALPAPLFADPENDPLWIDLTLADGSAPPAWLSLDTNSMQVTGTPPPGFSGDLQLVITATDGLSLASAAFTLTIGQAAGMHLVGTDGDDHLVGMSGADTIEGLGGDDTLQGSGGDDTFIAAGHAGFDTYDGGGGSDTILGSNGNDVIGLAGGSTALVGIEAIDGGNGFDVVRGAKWHDLVDLSAVAVTGIELIATFRGADTIIGSSAADTISGGAGADCLAGGDGDDMFLVDGAAGLDDYDGGTGFDVILGGSGDDVIGLVAGSASLASIERIDGGDGYDLIRGAGNSDLVDLSAVELYGIEAIRTFAGDDTIFGSAASDTIDGGTGRDRLAGGRGDDVLTGGVGADVFVFAPGGGHDIVLDFQIGTASRAAIDRIDLSQCGFVDFAHAMTHAAPTAAATGTTFTLDSGDTLELRNINLADLREAHVIL